MRRRPESESIKIPESEYSLDFVRASGPGGQKVQKTSTKTVLHWDIGASEVLSDDEKALVREYAGRRVTAADELVFTSQEERSQRQNRERAIAKLNNLVNRALVPKKERIPTKPSRAAVRRRLEEKRRISRKKAERRKKFKENHI